MVDRARGQGSPDDDTWSTTQRPTPAPGKRSLTEQLPVQQRAAPARTGDPIGRGTAPLDEPFALHLSDEEVHQPERRGTGSASESVPLVDDEQEAHEDEASEDEATNEPPEPTVNGEPKRRGKERRSVAASEPIANSSVGEARPVQRRGQGEATTTDIHAAARTGISGPSGELPHRAAIQAAFGHHDVSGIAAHTDSAAVAGSAAMGAEAFATGNDVAFGSSSPSLHTAAHEAAHIVQQRGGVHLKGGVGEEGDAWERHADAVADRVVDGRSAQDLLDQVAVGATTKGPGSVGGSSGGVQRKGFTPTFTVAPNPAKVGMEEDAKIKISVSNAALAPAGTGFTWKWGTVDGERVTKTSLSPGTGTATTASVHTKVAGPTPVPTKLEVASQGAAPAVHDVTPTPAVEAATPTFKVTRKLKPGRLSKNSVDDLQPGDTVSLVLDFSGHGDPRGKFTDKNLLHWTVDQLSSLDKEDHPFQEQPLVWQDKDTAVLDVYVHHAGSAVVSLHAVLPGAAVMPQFVNLKATSTWKFFRDRCGAATDRALRLLGMADTWLHDCFVSYKQAYDQFQAVIDAYSARRKLTRDIALGILFAGIGGAAGGAAGALVTARFTTDQMKAAGGILGAIANSKTAVAAISDGAKDMVKYTARLPVKLAGGTGGTSETPDESGGVGPAPRGRDAVPAVDPATWYHTLASAKANEQTVIAKTIEDWKEAATDAEAKGNEQAVPFDPINAVTESMKIDGLSITELGAAPSSIHYEKNFWEVWVGKYGFEMLHLHPPPDFGDGELVTEEMYLTSPAIPSEHSLALQAIDKKLKELNVEKNWLSSLFARARAPIDAKVKKGNDELEAQRQRARAARESADPLMDND